MKYKPTEEILTAYLYGELESEEANRVAEYLEANPEEKAMLQSLSDTRMILNELDDEEMPEQLAFMSASKNEEWLYWRKYVAIAATLLLVLTFGWVSGFKVNYDQEGLYLGYGEVQRGLTEDQVARMIDDNSANVINYLEETSQITRDSINMKFQTLQASNNDEVLIKKIFDQEKDALVNQMLGLNDKLSEDYREILRQIVVNFSNNIETQRIEDLRSIQAAFTDLEDATIGKQFELEGALSVLEEKVNAVIINTSNNK